MKPGSLHSSADETRGSGQVATDAGPEIVAANAPSRHGLLLQINYLGNRSVEKSWLNRRRTQIFDPRRGCLTLSACLRKILTTNVRSVNHDDQ